MGFNLFTDVLGMSHDPLLGSPISQMFGGPSPVELAERQAREQGMELVAQPIGTAAAQEGQMVSGIDNTVLLLGGVLLLVVLVVAMR